MKPISDIFLDIPEIPDLVLAWTAAPHAKPTDIAHHATPNMREQPYSEQCADLLVSPEGFCQWCIRQ